jgi:cephalosporin hydroxylase
MAKISADRPEYRTTAVSILRVRQKSTFAAKLQLLPTAFGDRKLFWSQFLYRSTGNEAEEYHKWYFNEHVWWNQQWMGVDCHKSPCDMWNYQEILFNLKPSVLVEFGSYRGGSALFFASVMRQIGQPFKLISVDIDHTLLDPTARRDPDVEFMESSSSEPAVADRIRELKAGAPGPMFVILDSDHRKPHVLAEMKLLRPLLSQGDYLVVEDSMLNGHPVAPGWGEGPFEAIAEYEREFPNDYKHDSERETKFGWTQATNGFLIRN